MISLRKKNSVDRKVEDLRVSDMNFPKPPKRHCNDIRAVIEPRYDGYNHSPKFGRERDTSQYKMKDFEFKSHEE